MPGNRTARNHCSPCRLTAAACDMRRMKSDQSMRSSGPAPRCCSESMRPKAGSSRWLASMAVLHLATHGQFNKLNPLLSGLELEADGIDDGMLQVHEVLGLRLNADLVTLSACDTALGSGHLAMVPAGDEFVGMTRAFLSAGSSSVVATLWEVDDRSSGKLMRRFYEHLAAIDAPCRQGGRAGARTAGTQIRQSVFAPLLLGPVHPGRRSGSTDPRGDSDMKVALRGLFRSLFPRLGCSFEAATRHNRH